MTIVYDQKRDRLVFLSANEDRQPELWFLSLGERRWSKNPKPAPGGVSTREAVYVPDQDAILAYGPARKDDPVWTRVYLCAENRWVPLPIETPRYIVHEVALEYDPIHAVAILLWPPSFEADVRAQTSDYLVASASMFAGYALLVLGLCVGYTHGLIGPTVALKRQARMLRDGDYTARTRLRQGNTVFADLATDLNAVAEMLEQDAGTRGAAAWRN